MMNIHGGPSWTGGTYDKYNKQIILPIIHTPWFIRTFYVGLGILIKIGSFRLRFIDLFLILRIFLFLALNMFQLVMIFLISKFIYSNLMRIFFQASQDKHQERQKKPLF